MTSSGKQHFTRMSRNTNETILTGLILGSFISCLNAWHSVRWWYFIELGCRTSYTEFENVQVPWSMMSRSRYTYLQDNIMHGWEREWLYSLQADKFVLLHQSCEKEWCRTCMTTPHCIHLLRHGHEVFITIWVALNHLSSPSLYCVVYICSLLSAKCRCPLRTQTA